MSRARNISSLFEEIYGKLAVGYHRSKIENLDGLIRNPFASRIGGDYGPGLYLTYDLKSQMTPYMIDAFGTLLIKYKVNLHGMLIFEKDIASRVYGPHGITIREQLKNLFGIDEHHPRFPLKFLAPEKLDAVLNSTTNSRFTNTSKMAGAFYWNQVPSNWAEKNTRGMVYKETGNTASTDTHRGSEGNQILVYDQRSAVPMAYAISDSLNRPLNWIPINSLQHIKRTLREPHDLINTRFRRLR